MADVAERSVFAGPAGDGSASFESQRAMLQARVDKLGVEFRGSVVAGRQREIGDDVMQGQSFDADEAVRNGLIDAVCSFDEALSGASYLGKMRKAKGR